MKQQELEKENKAFKRELEMLRSFIDHTFPNREFRIMDDDHLELVDLNEDKAEPITRLNMGGLVQRLAEAGRVKFESAKPTIIGISGRIGSGKDTVGQIIQYLTTGPVSKVFTFEEWVNKPHYSREAAPWQIKKFADKLKECASIITGITRADFERIDTKNGLISEDWGELTVRKFLQLFGTEVGRSIHENFWVNALFSDYKKPAQLAIERTGGYTNSLTPTEFLNWIITDVRFSNEANAINARGGIMIRLNRNSGVDSDHISETALDTYTEFDYVIDNSNTTINELIQIVKNILIIEHIITKD